MGVAAMAVARSKPTLLGMTGVQAGAGSSGCALLLAFAFLVSLIGFQLHAAMAGEVGVDPAAEALLAVAFLGVGLAHWESLLAHWQSLLRTGRCLPHQLVLPGNTTEGRSVDASSTCSMTSKGQVTIPKALRQQLGLARGSRVSFQLVGDHIEVRPCKPQQPVSGSGFGLLKSQCPPVPVDFDPASLLRP
jgi:AbrB family looped-hinge helix DNA binding protein